MGERGQLFEDVVRQRRLQAPYVSDLRRAAEFADGVVVNEQDFIRGKVADFHSQESASRSRAE